MNKEAKEEQDEKINRIRQKVLAVARMRMLHECKRDEAFCKLHMAKHRSGDGMLPPETFEKFQDIKVDVVKFHELKRRDSINEKFPIQIF